MWELRAIRPRQSTGRRARGFTLLEILIVLALLVLLAGISWPAMHARLMHSQLPEAADRFRSLMYLARAEAMREHRRFRIRFEPGSQQPIVEPEMDPIAAAGVYLLVADDWTVGSALPEGVHVHDVIPGRPAYLTPVSSATPSSWRSTGMPCHQPTRSTGWPEPRVPARFWRCTSMFPRSISASFAPFGSTRPRTARI